MKRVMCIWLPHWPVQRLRRITPALRHRPVVLYCRQAKGQTLVPLKMYFKNGRAKVELAIASGKKLHDKRESAKKADAQREIRREMSNRRR